MPTLYTIRFIFLISNKKATIKSRQLDPDDCIVAATAFISGSILATGNGKHYPMKDVKKTNVRMGKRY
jgi:hypothetical protein